MRALSPLRMNSRRMRTHVFSATTLVPSAHVSASPMLVLSVSVSVAPETLQPESTGPCAGTWPP